MNASFPVDWKRLFKSLTLTMSIMVITPVTIVMMVRYVSMGFDYGKTFEHISLPLFLLLLVCSPVFCAPCALVIALWFCLAAITIDGATICGRTYWGWKNRIPLTDITGLTRFSKNGLNALVVSSQQHGQIYISVHTERLGELLAILNDYLPIDQKITIAGQDRSAEQSRENADAGGRET